MCVRRGCKWNPLPHGEFNDSIARIKFVYRFAPAGSGEFNRKIARANEVKRFTGDRVNLRIWPMTMDFDEIEMCKAINEPSRCHFADTAEVIGVNCIDIASFELRSPGRDAVEHLISAIKEMNGAQHKVEFVPISFDPFSSGCRVDWIVVELDPRA